MAMLDSGLYSHGAGQRVPGVWPGASFIVRRDPTVMRTKKLQSITNTYTINQIIHNTSVSIWQLKGWYHDHHQDLLMGIEYFCDSIHMIQFETSFETDYRFVKKQNIAFY